MSHPVQEEDRVATGKIVATAIISLAIFGVGALWSVSIQRNEVGSILNDPHTVPAAEAGKPEVGLVYQWPFFKSQYGHDKAVETAERLTSYGYVDKSAGVVRIPIEQAIQKYVAESGGNQ
jgi:hypothetical protein